MPDTCKSTASIDFGTDSPEWKEQENYALLAQLVKEHGGTVHLVEETGIYLILVPDEKNKAALVPELEKRLGRFYIDLCGFVLTEDQLRISCKEALLNILQ